MMRTAACFAMLIGALLHGAPVARAQNAAVPDSFFVAHPGDQIRITVWPSATFGPPLTATVDLNGTVLVPPIGLLNVLQTPITALRDTIRVHLTKYIREPEVDVQLARRITVNGAVLRPDIYFMDPSATLRDAIARAGGVTEVGSRSKVSIIRDGRSVHVSDWESDVSPVSLLRSGDQVIVGRRSWIEINIIPVASLGLATASFLLSLRK